MRLINKHLEDKDYDVIYTHGESGEYRHIRHKEIHQTVNKMLDSGMLKAKRIYYFNYRKKEGYCAAIKSKDYYKLNDEELKEKKKIITEMYGFEIGSFEEKSCGDESFIQK